MDDLFFHKTAELLARLHETQEPVLRQAAELIYERISQGGRFYATGTGHSHMMAEELYSRAGGLAFVRMIAPPEFTLDAHPMKSTLVERIPQYAQVVLTQYPVHPGDVLLIASNSGRNGLVVELALQAQARGAAVIALTSLRHSAGCASRHPSGKLLKDVAELVIDNCAEAGDAATPLGDSGITMGATSTIAGAYLMERLAMLVAQKYLDNGQVPPVLRSSNLDGSDERNRALFSQYYQLDLT